MSEDTGVIKQVRQFEQDGKIVDEFSPWDDPDVKAVYIAKFLVDSPVRTPEGLRRQHRAAQVEIEGVTNIEEAFSKFEATAEEYVKGLEAADRAASRIIRPGNGRMGL